MNINIDKISKKFEVNYICSRDVGETTRYDHSLGMVIVNTEELQQVAIELSNDHIDVDSIMEVILYHTFAVSKSRKLIKLYTRQQDYIKALEIEQYELAKEIYIKFSKDLVKLINFSWKNARRYTPKHLHSVFNAFEENAINSILQGHTGKSYKDIISLLDCQINNYKQLKCS